MIEKTKGKTFTVADLYSEAAKLVKEEFSGIKDKPLNKTEEVKMQELARLISNTVLKEMKIV